jgi:hypothetical protein
MNPQYAYAAALEQRPPEALSCNLKSALILSLSKPTGSLPHMM